MNHSRKKSGTELDEDLVKVKKQKLTKKNLGRGEYHLFPSLLTLSNAIFL